MLAGLLRKRVDIQREAKTDDGAGGYALAWQTIATVWARLQPASGRDLFKADHLQTRVTHKITLRYEANLTLTPDLRVLYGERAFHIRAILNDGEANKSVTLLVEEGGPT